MDVKLYDFDKFLDENGNVINSDDMECSLSGHNIKTFVRCDSEFFRRLFDELKNNQNCSYVTYLNDFIKEDYDGKTLPISTISCFKKEADYSDIEEISSCLANQLQIPTAYVVNVKDNPNYVLSVDFISSDEIFDTLDKYYDSTTSFCYSLCSHKDTLQNWYSKWVSTSNSCINPDTKEVLSKDVLLKLFKEFLPHYFFRKYIIKDYDFESKNVGFLYNKKTHCYKLAPLFDMEYAFFLFNESLFATKMFNNFERDFNFAIEIAPDIMKDFFTRIMDLYKSGKINYEWLNEYMKSTNCYNLSDDMEYNIVHSLDFIAESIDILQLDSFLKLN